MSTDTDRSLLERVQETPEPYLLQALVMVLLLAPAQIFIDQFITTVGGDPVIVAMAYGYTAGLLVWDCWHKYCEPMLETAARDPMRSV